MRGFAMTTFRDPSNIEDFSVILTRYNYDFELNLTLKELEEFEKEAEEETKIFTIKAREILKGSNHSGISLKTDEDYR